MSKSTSPQLGPPSRLGGVAREDWISFHVFHRGDLNALLLETVRPLVDSLRREGEAKSYFFVRYWNGGSHLRLRVLPGEEARAGLEDRIRACLEDRLRRHPGPPGDAAAYLKQSAFMRRLRDKITAQWAEAETHLDEEEPFQSEDAVLSRPYRFEWARYGGERARRLTEDHFRVSSDLALSVIADSGSNKGRLTAWAGALMACLTPALNLPPVGAASLFSKYLSVARQVYPEITGDFAAAMGFRSFQSQAGLVVDLISQAESPSAAPNPRLAGWMDHLERCASELRGLEAEKDTSMPAEEILMDFLHLLNNRLGIPLQEELYLAYLLEGGYKEVAQRS